MAVDQAGHQARSRSAVDWSKVTVPLLSAASWDVQGLHPRGNFEAFMRAASTEKWLEGHSLEHWTHFYTDYGRLLQKRFFDHYLKSAGRSRRGSPCRRPPRTPTCSSCSFDPDGQEVLFSGTIAPHTPVGQGWLRASHRKLDPQLTLPYRPYHSHDEKQPRTPGTRYDVDVEARPTCIVAPAGHRIALTVRGTDYDYGGEPVNVGWLVMKGSGVFLHDDPTDRPAEVFGGTVTLHTGGDDATYLLLPVIPHG